MVLQMCEHFEIGTEHVLLHVVLTGSYDDTVCRNCVLLLILFLKNLVIIYYKTNFCLWLGPRKSRVLRRFVDQFFILFMNRLK